MRPLSLWRSCRLSATVRPIGPPLAIVTTVASGSSSNCSHPSLSLNGLQWAPQTEPRKLTCASLFHIVSIQNSWSSAKCLLWPLRNASSPDNEELQTAPVTAKDFPSNAACMSTGSTDSGPCLSSNSFPWWRMPECGCDVRYHHHTPCSDSSLLFSFSLSGVPHEFTFEEYLPRPGNVRELHSRQF